MLLSLLTLPMPDFFYNCFRAKILPRGQKVEIREMCWLNEVFLYLIGFGSYFLVLALLIAFYILGGDEDSIFKITKQQVHVFVLVYYLTIPLFGWFFLNLLLRLSIIARYASVQAKFSLK